MSSFKGTRIVYADIVKAFMIFCVIWHHVAVELPDGVRPSWCTLMFDDGLFFFLSGMFYKRTVGLREHIIRDFKRIAIPGILFYFGSIPLLLVIRYFDYGSIEGYLNVWIFDPIRWGKNVWFPLNISVWFLSVLIFVRLLWRLIEKLPKWVILILIVATIFWAPPIVGLFPMPLLINHAFYWWIWFGIGCLLKPWIVKTNDTLRGSVYAFCASIGYCAVILTLPESTKNGFLDAIISLGLNLRYAFYGIGLLSGVSIIEKLIKCSHRFLSIYNVLGWVGTQTMGIMLMHWNLITIVDRCVRPWVSSLWTSTLSYSFIISLIIMLLILPVSVFLQRYAPWSLGEKSHQKVSMDMSASHGKVAL